MSGRPTGKEPDARRRLARATRGFAPAADRRCLLRLQHGALDRRADRDPTLTLAGILALASVGSRLAGTLPLAGVDALAIFAGHTGATGARRRLRIRGERIGCEQCSSGRDDSLILHDFLLLGRSKHDRSLGCALRSASHNEENIFEDRSSAIHRGPRWPPAMSCSSARPSRTVKRRRPSLTMPASCQTASCLLTNSRETPSICASSF